MSSAYLLDTNVVSELRKQRPHGGVVAWLALVAGAYNVLPMDAATFRAWARLMHRTSETLYEDAMIAATAKVHGLTVATRNVCDFNALGLDVFNPFAPAQT